MKQLLLFMLFACFLAGCSSAGPEAKENKPMRDAMSGKDFDPDKMPPEAKAMMEKMSKQGPGAPAGGGAATATPK